MVHLLQVLREVEHDPLAHEARAEFREDQRDDHGIADDLGQQFLEGKGLVLGQVRTAAVAGVEVRQARVAGPVAHQQVVHQHHDGHGPHRREPDDGPALEAGQEPGAHGGGQEVARTDHDPEDAPEDPPLPHVEPGAVHLDHAQGPEALEVHVDAPEEAHGHQQLGGEPVEEHESHQEVGQGGPQRPHEDRPASADAVGQRPVDGHGQAVGPESRRGDDPHLPLVQVVPGPDIAFDDIEVVPAHVHGRVGEAKGKPVQEAPEPERFRMLHAMLRHLQLRRCRCRVCSRNVTAV